MEPLPAWLDSLPPAWRDGCDAALFAAAHAAYQSPGRFYHTWSHVEACVDTLRAFPCDSPRPVFLALVFHDAIYVPDSPDNENLSAELASRMLRRHTSLDAAEIAAVHRIILATRDHTVAELDHSRDLRAALDIDMSILASPWARYRAHADGVRMELCPAVVDAAGFTAGRAEFLRKLLASRRIFHTREGLQRWEEKARMNIARELGELMSPEKG